MQYGGELPFDSAVLATARRWGCPPWVVEDGPAYWYLRDQQEQNIAAQVAEAKTGLTDHD